MAAVKLSGKQKHISISVMVAIFVRALATLAEVGRLSVKSMY